MECIYYMILELSQTFGLIDSSSHKFHEKYEREFGGKKNTINITIIFSSKPKKTKTKNKQTLCNIISQAHKHIMQWNPSRQQNNTPNKSHTNFPIILIRKPWRTPLFSLSRIQKVFFTFNSKSTYRGLSKYAISSFPHVL